MALKTSCLIAAAVFIAAAGIGGPSSAYPRIAANKPGVPDDGSYVLMVRGHGGGFARGRQGGGSRYVHRPTRAFLARRFSARANGQSAAGARAPYSWWRRRPGNSQASTNYPARQPTGGEPGRNPPQIGNRRDPVWRRNVRPPVPYQGTESITIAGFGGQRPPIAPHFSSSGGQQPGAAAAALLDNKRYRPRELLIEVANDSADQLKRVLANRYGVEVRELGVIELVNTRIWHLTLVQGQDLRTVLEQLLQDNRVISAQPNYIYTPVQGSRPGGLPTSLDSAALTEPSDARLPSGAGVKIAIIDTCVDRGHVEIQGAVTAFFDALPSRAQECKAENHGTEVASLIGGHGQLHGTAAGASLMSVRALALTEEENEVAGTSREIALALNWAATSNARVVNLSFAGPSDPLIEREVAAAYRKGIVLVGAAGNGGPSSDPLYPAAYPEVIAVTATDAKRQLYEAANRGPYISVSARGVDVLVARVNNAYGTDSGTSFAAATVSGIVALMLERRPNASPDEIRAALQNTALDTSGKGRNALFGYGLVNARAAVTFLESGQSR